jgi:hypothetical protein
MEYIKAMIEFARDDARHVHYRVAGSLAIVALYLTQLPFERLAELSDGTTRLLFAGLAAMLAGAVLHFKYLSRMHLSRRQLIQCLPDNDVECAYDALVTNVKRSIGWFWAGDAAMLIGLTILAYVLWELLGLPPRPTAAGAG